MQTDLNQVHYAGFWARVFASILDSLLQILVIMPLLFILFGSAVFTDPDFDGGLGFGLIEWGLPAVVVILFWIYKSATPGKMMMGLIIVDADTGLTPRTSRLILRYFAYAVSVIPLFLGFFWVAFDKRKQGFHDKIAHTLVIRAPEAPDADQVSPV